MKFLFYTALAAAALVKRQEAATVTSVPVTLNNGVVVNAVLTVGPSGAASSTATSASSVTLTSTTEGSSTTTVASSTTPTSVPVSSVHVSSAPVSSVVIVSSAAASSSGAASSEAAVSSAVQVNEFLEQPSVAPQQLTKRQAPTYVITLGNGACGASTATFTFGVDGLTFEFSSPNFCSILSVSVTETPGGATGCTNVNIPGSIPGCNGVPAISTTTTSVPTTITTATTATTTAISVTTTTSTTTVIGNPLCGCYDHIFTYWYYTAYVCAAAQINVPFLFCGQVQICKTVGVCYFPTSYVLTGAQVATVTLINGYTAPYVPLVVSTISNNVVTVPASTVQTYATLPPPAVVSQIVAKTAVQPPPVVTAYAGAASKAGLGALAAIAGAAALL